jgi:hemin uptake protein HemP
VTRSAGLLAESSSKSVRNDAAESVLALTGSVIAASDLFGNRRELTIEHAGFQYRLRITQNNKLILTK